MEKPTIWVIDDDVALRLILDDTLNDAGFLVKTFGQAKLAWQQLEQSLEPQEQTATPSNLTLPRNILPHAIITDIRMPMMDGLSFSEKIQTQFAHIPVIIMTAHADVQSAVDSYQAGAFDYLPKPFELEEAVSMVTKAVAQYASTQNANDNQNLTHQKPVEDETFITNFEPFSRQLTKNTTTEDATTHKNPSGIIGQSVGMQQVFRAIGRLASTHINVLINGESGTGKELVANALHEHSPRKHKPFIALNMAAIPHDLIESELFGHEKGAFTGATTTRQGRFEQAHGGTLFLDEIGDMPLPTQTRLLRVLANGEFFRVGGQKPVKVDVRIIAATHQHLESLVKQGKFREDLFYRLNVIRLTLPALRERRDDIPLLVKFFMNTIAQSMNIPPKTITPNAMQILQTFDWQGNIRQLENTCRWFMVMASGQQVQASDLPPEILTFYQVSLTLPNVAPLESRTKKLMDNEKYNFPESSAETLALVTNQNPKNGQHNGQNRGQDNEPNSDWLTPLAHWVKHRLESGDSQALQTATVDFERCLLQTTLQYTGNHKGKTSELLGWGRNTVTRKFQLLLKSGHN